MKNKISITVNIPPKAKILLIDVQESFLEQSDYYQYSIVKAKVDHCLERMSSKFSRLKAEGHEIIAVYDHSEGLHPTVESLPDERIDLWEFYDEDHKMYLNPEIPKLFKKDEPIIVCGLWREMCVMSVTKLLCDLGYDAAMLLDDHMTISARIAWLDEGIEELLDHCVSHGISIESKGEDWYVSH